METVVLDGSGWKSCIDFYTALLSALKPLGDHGFSMDAFIDSMVYGGMLEIMPPYQVLVRDIASPEVRRDVETLSRALAAARRLLRDRRDEDVDVTLRFVPD
jgi:hypothetical protein